MKKIGVLATLIYLALILYWIFRGWYQFSELAPNEWGDFFAGTIGPIALLWVILSFWLQSQELSNSVMALNLQTNELKNSVEQQKEALSVAQGQFQIQQDAYLASHERYQNELLEKRQSQISAVTPYFVLDYAGGQSSNNNYKNKFKLTNRGGDALTVQVAQNTPDIGVEVAKHRNISKSEEITIQLNSRVPLLQIQEASITIISTGLSKWSRRQTFRVDTPNYPMTSNETFTIDDVNGLRSQSD